MNEEQPTFHLPSWAAQLLVTLAGTGVIAVGGVFVQVSKIDSVLQILMANITELKADTRERLNRLEVRVHRIETRR